MSADVGVVCTDEEPCWDADTMGNRSFGPEWDCAVEGDGVCDPSCRPEGELTVCGPVPQPLGGVPTEVVAVASPVLPATGAPVDVIAVNGLILVVVAAVLLWIGRSERRERRS